MNKTDLFPCKQTDWIDTVRPMAQICQVSWSVTSQKWNHSASNWTMSPSLMLKLIPVWNLPLLLSHLLSTLELEAMRSASVALCWLTYLPGWFPWPQQPGLRVQQLGCLWVGGTERACGRWTRGNERRKKWWWPKAKAKKEEWTEGKLYIGGFNMLVTVIAVFLNCPGHWFLLDLLYYLRF